MTRSQVIYIVVRCFALPLYTFSVLFWFTDGDTTAAVTIIECRGDGLCYYRAALAWDAGHDPTRAEAIAEARAVMNYMMQPAVFVEAELMFAAQGDQPFHGDQLAHDIGEHRRHLDLYEAGEADGVPVLGPLFDVVCCYWFRSALLFLRFLLHAITRRVIVI